MLDEFDEGNISLCCKSMLVKYFLQVNGQVQHFELLVVFVNKVCDFNGIEFTGKGVCRIVFATLVFRFLSYWVTIILTSFWCVQHRKAGQNTQQLVPSFLILTLNPH